MQHTIASKRLAMLAELNDMVGIQRNVNTAPSSFETVQHHDASYTPQTARNTQSLQQQQPHNSTLTSTTTTIPRIDALSTIRSPSQTKFGTSARFTTATGQFGSSNSVSSELLCTAGPGFKYNPNYSMVKQRAKGVVEWKIPRIELLMRAAVERQQQMAATAAAEEEMMSEEESYDHHNEEKQNDTNNHSTRPPKHHKSHPTKPISQLQLEQQMTALLHGGQQGAAVGQYNVKLDYIKPMSPRPIMGSASRFDTTASNNLAATTTNVQQLQPSFKHVETHAPAWSFTAPLRKTYQQPAQPRTSWMTHSIEGGLARPATLEVGLSPADYNPQYETIAQKSFAVARNAEGQTQNFGTATRFNKSATTFLSPQDQKTYGVGVDSPGMKYNPMLMNMSYKSKQARSMSLQWVP